MSTDSTAFEKLGRAGIAAVLVLEHEEDALPVAEALLAGGITAMELTLRTPAALGALRRITKALPQMLAGIGTIIKPDQVTQALDCGAAFGVAPGMSPRVVEKAIASGLPFAPGICTPSDIERALEYDCRLLKFFPAELCGGLKYLEAIAAPYAHLGLKYIPLGGVSALNCKEWLHSRLVSGIGGSWLAPQEIIAAKNWDGITDRAAHATELLRSCRPHS